jgi:hypothetical protein
MTDKFICLMAFSFGEVAEKLVYVGKLSLSYIDPHTNICLMEVGQIIFYAGVLQKA